jgi:two-component system response regulator HydG
MGALDEEIDAAARSVTSVLITAREAAVRKDIARAVHTRSERRGPLVSLNCAGVPQTLLEWELFGSISGSNTTGDQRGWFEVADGGTIFIDEIGDINPSIQERLMQFLELRAVQDAGSDEGARPLDVRVITGSRPRLFKHVQRGRFREDLYYRLNVVHLEVPSLREYREDVTAVVTMPPVRSRREVDAQA